MTPCRRHADRNACKINDPAFGHPATCDAIMQKALIHPASRRVKVGVFTPWQPDVDDG
jgi:hypothetical protein